MTTTLDVSTLTGGRFEPRVTADGAPVSIRLESGRLVIRRGDVGVQSIECATGLGGIALCGGDGAVLGFGTMDIGDLPRLADDVDRMLGATVGGPLERMALHGLHLVLPLDGMPDQVLGLFLLENVGPDLVADAAISDAHVVDAMREHDHEHGEDCDVCTSRAIDDVRSRVEASIASHGHAVIGIAGDAGNPFHSYTVGLSDVGWPELVVVGLEEGQARTVINSVVASLRSRERRPVAGMVLDDAVNVPLALHAVDPLRGPTWTRVAADHHARSGFATTGYAVLQILWPDVDGRFPTDGRYDGHNLPKQIVIG